MNSLTEMLKNVRTLKSIVGETKSITAEITEIVASIGINKSNNLIKSFVNSPYLILGVMKDDPKELVDAIYRLKAKYYHPDAETGNKEKFLKLKDAYDKIKQYNQ